jgi:hypothetical protein
MDIKFIKGNPPAQAGKSGFQGISHLPGHLVKCTYEGLPLEFPEWDDLYIEGEIPVGIWDVIRQKHAEYMKGEPEDWQVDELADITINTLTEAGLKVYGFASSSEFPALHDPIHLCDWCRCEMPDGDRVVQFRDSTFCTESCLFEALTQHKNPIRVVNIDPATMQFLLECPNCQNQDCSTNWEFEGSYIVSGEDGFVFVVMVCPDCQEFAAFVVPTLPGKHYPMALLMMKAQLDYAIAGQKRQNSEAKAKAQVREQDTDDDLIAKIVVSSFNVPGWVCSWEHPGYFHVQRSDDDTYYFAGNAYLVEDGKPVNQIRIDLHGKFGENYQSWAIPFEEDQLTPRKIIEAFANCITIFNTEEIPGVVH